MRRREFEVLREVVETSGPVEVGFVTRQITNTVIITQHTWRAVYISEKATGACLINKQRSNTAVIFEQRCHMSS